MAGRAASFGARPAADVNALEAWLSPAQKSSGDLDELARRNLRRTALYWRGKLPMIDCIDRGQRDAMIAKYKNALPFARMGDISIKERRKA